ncbi:hypothetical protein ACFSR6_18035 [Pedobacter vanadiisoli]|uniref:Uncharacterized protein n=1 Tax=Pedobacter vanadiisoli TaxID=1761975 RepID=A0ABW5MM70_9SPHI
MKISQIALPYFKHIGSLGTAPITFHHPTSLTEVRPSIPRAREIGKTVADQHNQHFQTSTQ